MAWMQCRGCSAKFAVGLLRCPQCNAISELYAVPEETIEAEQEANMPKISVEGGPSNALGEPVEPEAPEAGPAESPEQAEPEVSDETSDATSDATDEETEPGGDDVVETPSHASAAVTAEPEPAPASKPAKKAAAKKTAAKAEPAPKG
jgi:hypothetical protein